MEPRNIVFFGGFLVYVVIRGVFEERTKGLATVVGHVDPVERALLSLVFLGCILLPVVYLATDWLAFADYHVPLFASIAGVAIMIAALWLFWRSHSDLGRNWSRSLELRTKHQLVRHGVYRAIRHPMYAAILMFGIAQGLLLENWLAGWSGLLAFGVMYLVRTPREEKMMCEHFGDEYRAYMRQSGSLWPRRRQDRSG
jgi:protein-S-isoprenylcysteine O-methyltransferase Ste14